MNRLRIDWGDVWLFHEMAASGTARGAALKLGISHSKLVRRLDGLEAQLGTKLFERSKRGVSLTEAGATLYNSTNTAADCLDDGIRKVSGLDQNMAGPIRVTMPDILAYYVLLPAIRDFQILYPDIQLELDISYETSDLNKREADIAIRMLNTTEAPPEQLVGRRVAQSHACGYATPDYIRKHDPASAASSARWLGWEVGDPGEWRQSTPYPHLELTGSFNHAELQHHAAVSGLGIAYMPCVLASQDSRLVKLPGMVPRAARDIWVLTHRDLQHARRMKLFRDCMVEVLRKAEPRLNGDV